MEIGCVVFKGVVVFDGPASDMFIFGLLGGLGIVFYVIKVSFGICGYLNNINIS